MKKAKKGSAVQSAAASLKGKKFDLTSFEREAAAAKIAEIERAKQGLILAVRRQVLERVGVPAKLVEVAQVKFFVEDGVPISLEIVNPNPKTKKEPEDSKPKVLKGGKAASGPETGA